MPQFRAAPVMLSAGERKVLKKRARGAKAACRDRLRAQIVLAAAGGRASAGIAADLHVSVDTVRKWRGRFAARGLDPETREDCEQEPDHRPGALLVSVGEQRSASSSYPSGGSSGAGGLLPWPSPRPWSPKRSQLGKVWATT